MLTVVGSFRFHDGKVPLRFRRWFQQPQINPEAREKIRDSVLLTGQQAEIKGMNTVIMYRCVFDDGRQV